MGPQRLCRSNDAIRRRPTWLIDKTPHMKLWVHTRTTCLACVAHPKRRDSWPIHGWTLEFAREATSTHAWLVRMETTHQRHGPVRKHVQPVLYAWLARRRIHRGLGHSANTSLPDCGHGGDVCDLHLPSSPPIYPPQRAAGVAPDGVRT
jgi:hypothetical protein